MRAMSHGPASFDVAVAGASLASSASVPASMLQPGVAIGVVVGRSVVGKADH